MIRLVRRLMLEFQKAKNLQLRVDQEIKNSQAMKHQIQEIKQKTRKTREEQIDKMMDLNKETLFAVNESIAKVLEHNKQLKENLMKSTNPKNFEHIKPVETNISPEFMNKFVKRVVESRALDLPSFSLMSSEEQIKTFKSDPVLRKILTEVIASNYSEREHSMDTLITEENLEKERKKHREEQNTKTINSDSKDQSNK